MSAKVVMEGRGRDVAVVGTGMAGLVTAYLLHHDRQQRFRVHLLDKVCCGPCRSMRPKPFSVQYIDETLV